MKYIMIGGPYHGQVYIHNMNLPVMFLPTKFKLLIPFVSCEAPSMEDDVTYYRTELFYEKMERITYYRHEDLTEREAGRRLFLHMAEMATQ